MRGKFAKLQLNNEQGWQKSALFFIAENFFNFFSKTP
jgi:hypothetical protein